MKKVLFALVLITTTVVLAGCGSRNRDSEEVPFVRADCIFLQDFDYMVQLLEDTFPLFGVAERRFGIDLREMLRESREFIAGYPYSLIAKADGADLTLLYNEGLSIDFDNLPELDAHLFWGLLNGSFFMRIPMSISLGTIGHLNIVDSGSFDYHHRTFGFAANMQYDHRYSDREEKSLSYFSSRPFLTPNAIRFYQEFPNYFSDLAFFDGSYSHIAVSALVALLFNPGLMEEMNEIFESTAASHTFPETTPIHHASTTSYTILEEGNIAYLRIPSFKPDFGMELNEQVRLLNFYRTIQNYDHLIIDIRGNPGGYTNMWYTAIMYALWPNMENIPNMPLYALFVDSELGRTLADANLLLFDRYSFYTFEVDNVYASYLPYLNEADISNLSHRRRINTNLGARRRNPIMSNTPFTGQIWLLTCSNNYSSAEMFSRHAKYMNFATLVGETTRGGHTYGRMFFGLPNTGIALTWDIDYVTDAYGRSLEEFPTTPHYFNREGLCAFQTVMEMISERS